MVFVPDRQKQNATLVTLPLVVLVIASSLDLITELLSRIKFGNRAIFLLYDFSRVDHFSPKIKKNASVFQR